MSVSTDRRTGSLTTCELTNTDPSSMGMSVSCLESIGFGNKFVVDAVEGTCVLMCESVNKL